MTTTLYWAYGANLNQRSMAQRCPRAVPVGAYLRRDLELRFAGVATVAPGSGCPGGLWLITPECEQHLDWFEGYPFHYRKEYFDINGQPVMYYVINDAEPGVPTQSYVDMIRQGYRDFGLDQDYLDQAVETACQHLEDTLKPI
jgi:hypothetical protein